MEKMKVNETKEQGIITQYIGKRELIDINTGDRVELEMVEKRVKHTQKRGWRRVYLENFLEILTGLYNNGKKIEVVEFILNNLNSENQLTLTQNQVIEKSKISRRTVVDTYKYLVQSNFMKKQGAVFVINPEFINAFGSDKKNGIIAIKYTDAEPSFDDIEPSFKPTEPIPPLSPITPKLPNETNATNEANAS